jgi:hypothetical protein
VERLLKATIAKGGVLVWILGVYAIAFGLVQLILGFKLRGLERNTRQMSPHPA